VTTLSRLSDKELLIHLAHVAEHRFGLTVWQWLPGPCHGHAPGSLHYQTFPASRVGRAFDACAPMTWRGRRRMARYARWVKRTHGSRLTEGIYNGAYTKLSIKRGHTYSPSIWGAQTWAAHRNHVHVGI
jgi:hypothetical protein